MNKTLPKDKCIDYLARIIYLAVKAKTNLQSITTRLAASEFINNIERGDEILFYNKTPFEIFKDIFEYTYIEDDSFGNYNDAYWCGYVYMNIFLEYKKPFAYIFLKLPLKDLLDMYPIYHEMDITEVFEEFERKEKDLTIMRALLSKHDISAAKLSRESGVPQRTIEYFKVDDERMYKASYANIHRIALALNEPNNLFLKIL